MPTPSTNTLFPDHEPQRSLPAEPPRATWIDALFQRDRLWLLIIVLIVAALFLGGCHARSGVSCHTSCGSSSADSALAVFYVVYLLGWIIVSSTGG